MTIFIACLLAMTFMGSAASLFLKKTSGSTGILALAKDKNLYLGGFLYLAAAVLNIWLLRYLDYSVVLPLTSLTYVWTMILSKLFLNEKITGRKMAGVLLLLAGAVMVSQ